MPGSTELCLMVAKQKHFIKLVRNDLNAQYHQACLMKHALGRELNIGSARTCIYLSFMMGWNSLVLTGSMSSVA